MSTDYAYRKLTYSDLAMHRLTIGETDLSLYLPPHVWNKEVEKKLVNHIVNLRVQLQAYIKNEPIFFSTHKPYIITEESPQSVKKMAQAAFLAQVGPMAAVAGLFAQEAAEFLQSFSSEVIVENGGDIYMISSKQRTIAIYAGDNLFTAKVGIIIPPKLQPLGICTSSGTVGHSFSYGKADAVTVLAHDGPLADAVATATANLIQSEKDFKKALDFALNIDGVSGILAIVNDKMAAVGSIEICSI